MALKEWDKDAIVALHSVMGLCCVVDIQANVDGDVVKMDLYDTAEPWGSRPVGQSIWYVHESDPKLLTITSFDYEEPYRRKGLYTRLLSDAIPFWQAMGFERLGIDRARDYLPLRVYVRSGFAEPNERRQLIGDLRPGGRLDQYREWKAGRAPEPEWHPNA